MDQPRNPVFTFNVFSDGTVESIEGGLTAVVREVSVTRDNRDSLIVRVVKESNKELIQETDTAPSAFFEKVEVATVVFPAQTEPMKKFGIPRPSPKPVTIDKTADNELTNTTDPGNLS